MRLTAGLAFSNNTAQDATALLLRHGCAHTVGHSARVAAAARQLAKRFGGDPAAAEQAGWLHDISTVIPNAERIACAEAWRIEALPEERLVPMIIHQKLSAYLAAQIFAVTDSATLSAIGCHTTLKPQPSQLDKIVFIADKWRWDGPGNPPYLAGLEAQIAVSLDAATRWFLAYLWDWRASLLVIHPWLAAAHADVVGNGVE